MKLSGNLITQLGNDKFYNYVEGERAPLPRIQLVSKGKYVDKGEIESGHYGIIDKDEVISDLGTSIDLLLLARRPKALDCTTNPMTQVFEPSSPDFRRIAEQSQLRDSGCMYGVSYLVFERSSSQFCEFFYGNKSLRERAYLLSPFLPLTEADIAICNLDARSREPSPATLGREFVSSGWAVPTIGKCSKRFTKVPNCDREITRFLNPIERVL